MKIVFDTFNNEKQKDAARAWCDPTVTDIIFGGAKGGGKSYLGAALIFGNALMYPDTRYFIARKQLIDLRKHTIPTIEKVFKDWGLKVDIYAKYNGQDNAYYLTNGSVVLLIEAKELPSDPMFERFGSMQMTQGWIEEAGEFEKNATTNLSIAVGRWNNDKYNLTGKILQTCNPKKNYLYDDYYLPWKAGTLARHKRFFQAFAHENKKNEAAYLDNLDRNLKGINRERLKDGNWEYSSDPACLIVYDKIIDIFSNTHVPSGAKKITSDIARLGGDRIVIIEWDGWRGKVTWHKRLLLTDTARYLEAARSRLGCGKSDVLIDSDGMGVGINDFIGYRGFVNNARPLPDPMKPRNELGKYILENFDMLKSQCYFRLADRINKNGIYLECEDDETRQFITRELELVKQKKMDDDMKKGVMPKDKVKEELGRSPDFSDTLMMREFFELQPSRQLADAQY